MADALRAEPNNPEVKELAAIVYSALGQHVEAGHLLQGLPQIDLAVFNALNQPPPTGFTTAIAVGESLLTRPEQQKNANLRVWMARAYGQKYRYERDTNHASEQDLAQIKQNVLREIRAALEVDPNTRSLLRSQWRDPRGDLAVFAPDDPELTGLLGGP